MSFGGNGQQAAFQKQQQDILKRQQASVIAANEAIQKKRLQLLKRTLGAGSLGASPTDTLGG